MPNPSKDIKQEILAEFEEIATHIYDEPVCAAHMEGLGCCLDSGHERGRGVRKFLSAALDRMEADTLARVRERVERMILPEIPHYIPQAKHGIPWSVQSEWEEARGYKKSVLALLSTPDQLKK